MSLIKLDTSCQLILSMSHLMYQFKCPLGEAFANKISTYICLITSTLSRHIKLYFSYISSISQHLKAKVYPTSKYKKKKKPENTSILQKDKKQKQIKSTSNIAATL